MHKLLIPIENFSGPALAATTFAVEFAKRNPAKLVFLIFSVFPRGGSGSPAVEKKGDQQRKQFEELIQQARSEKINLEIFYSSDDFVEAVGQCSRDQGLTEMIIAIPSEKDPAYCRVLEQIGTLRNSLESQIIIVKPKEEKIMEAAGLPTGKEQSPALSMKPPTGRKGL